MDKEVPEKVMARLTGKKIIICPDCKKICEELKVEKFETRLFKVDLEGRQLVPIPKTDWEINDFAYHCPHCDSLNVDNDELVVNWL